MSSRGTGKYLIIKYSEEAGKTNEEQPERLGDGPYQIQHYKDTPAAEKSKSIKRDHVRQPEMQPCFPLSSAPTRAGENACGRCISIEHKRICAVQTQPQPDN